MKLVAVTGCSNRNAQSKMAAESLHTAVQDSGDEIEIEVHGSDGKENTLKERDIESAEAVIVASDIPVDTDRFDTLPSVDAGVQAAITEPCELVERAREASENGEQMVDYERRVDSAGVVDRIKSFLRRK